MKVVILMEDTCKVPGCEYEHGLSVYIETAKHKVLMDTGASEKTLENAKKLGIDLYKVDAVIVSHGHSDHSGGSLHFPRSTKRPLFICSGKRWGIIIMGSGTSESIKGLGSWLA